MNMLEEWLDIPLKNRQVCILQLDEGLSSNKPCYFSSCILLQFQHLDSFRLSEAAEIPLVKECDWIEKKQDSRHWKTNSTAL